MADNSNLNEENSFYLDPNILVRRSYSYTNYLFYNRSIDTQNNPINRKYIGQFVLGERLGQGTFGVVVLGTHQITGEKVAVKILDKEKILQETDKSRLEREIKILKNMRHNNIVHLYDVKETPTSLYIIMEYINGKELFEYIISSKRLSELEACRFYQQIISGIEYLGKIKVVHRDIKPENLLLDNKNNIKIVDFGLSNSYPKNELLTTACGSPCYAAPEMINGERYFGLKADIWSSGIVLYAMLCGYLPFEEADNEKLYKKITEGKFKTPNFLSDSAKDILHRILNVDPKSRITIPQMKKHPWFNLINPKLNMTEGLLLNKVIVPIDENIIYKMVNEYKFNGEEIRTNLLLNNHNHITTTYFLILNQKLRNGEKSISNMKSKEFIKYIHNPNNLLSHYGNDMKKIISIRAKIPLIDKKNKEKNSANGLSGETQPGSSGMMKLGSSIEKLKRKEKRESSVRQRRKIELDNKVKENKYKAISVEKREKSKQRTKYNPRSVDIKVRKINDIKEKEKAKEQNKILSISPELKIKRVNDNDIYKMKNKKRNTDIKNKKIIKELKSEEKEFLKNNILEEIEENAHTKNYYNESNKKEKKENEKARKFNKLNKKAITNKNIIHFKRNKFDISIIENSKKESIKKQKIKRLVEKKNITEKRIQIKSNNIYKHINESNDKEYKEYKEDEENEDLMMNTDINNYVKMSKLMRRIKGKNVYDKKNNSQKKRNILEDEYTIKIPKINITERQDKDISNKNREEKEAVTDRYENENKSYMYNSSRKRNIITNIYNCKLQKNNNTLRNKLLSSKKNTRVNKKFIDTSVSFDKTNDENDIKRNNKDNLLITDEANHIEEYEDSEYESSNEDEKKNKEIEKEEEEFKRKEKDIKYLKLKSKHKKFNLVKNEELYKNNKDENTIIKNFKKTKTKNYNMENPIMNSRTNKYKNILIVNDKITVINPQKNFIQKKQNLAHHTTFNNYKKYLNYSKKKYLTERIGNQEIFNGNKNSSNSFGNDLYNNTFDNNNNNHKSYNKYKNRSKKNEHKLKNTILNYLYEESNTNNEMRLFDLSTINFYKNYNNNKELKERIKKELDNKKIKYNLKKNKFCCYYKNDNKFDIDIYMINEVKNIYIIKCIKKIGNINEIKYIFKLILSKLNYR